MNYELLNGHLVKSSTMPITVRKLPDGKYEVVDGCQRIRAGLICLNCLEYTNKCTCKKEIQS